MSAFDDAKRFIGQTRTWSMKSVHPQDMEVTCVRISAHISFDGESNVFTQLSVWCKYNDRGLDGSVWFIPDRFESLELIEKCSHGINSDDACLLCEAEIEQPEEDEPHCWSCQDTGIGTNGPDSKCYECSQRNKRRYRDEP